MAHTGTGGVEFHTSLPATARAGQVIVVLGATPSVYVGTSSDTWKEISGGGSDSLPDLTDNAGKFLKVNATEDDTEWDTPAGGSSAWTTVFKTADETKNSNAVLADDSELVATLSASKLYSIRLVVFFTSNTTPDFQYQMTFGGTTTRVTMQRLSLPPNSGTVTSGIAEAFDAAGVTVACATGHDGWLEANFTLSVGASGGTFSFKWAQNTSNAADTTVYAGSYLEYRQLN